MIYTIINTPLSVWTQLKLLFCLKHCQSWNARTLQTFFNLNIKTFSYLYGQIMLKLVQRFKRTGIQHVSSFSGRTNFMVWWKAILLCQRTEVQPGTGDRQTKKKKKVVHKELIEYHLVSQNGFAVQIQSQSNICYHLWKSGLMLTSVEPMIKWSKRCIFRHLSLAAQSLPNMTKTVPYS